MGTHHKSDTAVRKRKAQDQFAKTDANRKRKLFKHIKKQPNDLQAKAKKDEKY